MSIKRQKVPQTPEYESIYSKGFRIIKVCGEGNKGLVISVTISYFDQLILAQNTEYDNFHFLLSLYLLHSIQTNQAPQEPLYSYLGKLYAKQSDINEFTNACTTPEMTECLFDFGCQLLGINLNSSTMEIQTKQEEFSRKFNVQIHIYKINSNQPTKIAKNRLTDALILTILFKDNTYGTLYHEKYSEFSEQNLNCTKSFVTNAKTSEMIPLSAIQLISNDLKEIIIPEKHFNEISAAYNTLTSTTGNYPSLTAAVGGLLYPNDPCNKCNKQKTILTLRCGCSLCRPCFITSNSTHKCCACSKTLNPLDIQLINYY